MPDYLIDTPVLLEFLRGNQKTVEQVKQLARQGNRLGWCAATAAELYAALPANLHRKIQPLADSLYFYELTPSICRRAGEITRQAAKSGRPVSLANAINDAAAQEYDLTPVSATLRESQRRGAARRKI